MCVMAWHRLCSCKSIMKQEDGMSFQNILDGNLKITSMDDEQGRRYYSVKLAFSDNDILAVYRNSMDELVNELPGIISSAIQARILTDERLVN